MDDKEKSRPEGYKTIEEIAAGTDRSSGTIRNLIKKLRISKTVFPGDNRETVAPKDVKKIEDAITKGTRKPSTPNN
jgi:hypothetical protein